MSIECACEIVDYDDCAWYYEVKNEEVLLNTKYSRKCASCKTKIKPQEPVFKIFRWRYPRYQVEEHIYGDMGEIYIADWHYCPECYELHKFIVGMGWCYSIGDNLALALERAENRES